jgi:hypothetical protein
LIGAKGEKALNNLVKALIVLLLAFVVLSAITFTQSSKTLTVNGGGLVTVSEANAIWAKTYGGSADDRAFYTLRVDQDSLIVGSTKSLSNTTMGWLLMLDNQGDLIWNQTYLNGAGTELRYATAVSGGYLLVGNRFTSTGDVNGYIVKIDSTGAIIWQTIVGGDQTDKLFSGAVVSDGFIVCGLSNSYGGSGETAWAVKLDNAGQVVWNKIYTVATDSALRSAVSSSGGIVATGYQRSDGSSDNFDFTLLKIASDGSLTWNRSYGDSNSQKAYSITSALSGYVIVGDVTSSASNTDAWVLRVDSEGSEIWNRTVGGSDYDSASYVTLGQDGFYLVTGFTFSFGEGYRDFWLFSIDDYGQVGFCTTYGNSAYQEAYAAIDANSNQYILVGWTDPLGQSDMVGKAHYDFYVVKLSAEPSGPSVLTIGLSVTIFALLVAALALMIKIRRNKK